jgi:hypothetical protein
MYVSGKKFASQSPAAIPHNIGSANVLAYNVRAEDSAVKFNSPKMRAHPAGAGSRRRQKASQAPSLLHTQGGYSGT